MVALALLVLLQPGRAGVFYALLFAICAWIWARALPWRFAVLDEGIALWFPFGRRLFLPKEEVTVRVNTGSSASATRSPTGSSSVDTRCCAPCSSSTASGSPDDQPWAQRLAIGLGSTLKPTRSNQPA